MPRKSNASLGRPTALRWNARLYPRHKKMIRILAEANNTDMSSYLRQIIEEKAKIYGVFIPERKRVNND